jgi:hypothetical protein
MNFNFKALTKDFENLIQGGQAQQGQGSQNSLGGMFNQFTNPNSTPSQFQSSQQQHQQQQQQPHYHQQQAPNSNGPVQGI